MPGRECVQRRSVRRSGEEERREAVKTKKRRKERERKDGGGRVATEGERQGDREAVGGP